MMISLYIQWTIVHHINKHQQSINQYELMEMIIILMWACGESPLDTCTSDSVIIIIKSMGSKVSWSGIIGFIVCYRVINVKEMTCCMTSVLCKYYDCNHCVSCPCYAYVLAHSLYMIWFICICYHFGIQWLIQIEK